MKRKIAFLATAILFVGYLVFAQEATTPAPTDVTTVKGTIVDNMSVSAQKPETLSEFVKTYKKEDALKAPCAASGYSIYANGQIGKFNAASNVKIKEFLNKADSALRVEVIAKWVGDELSLVSIENKE